MADWRRRLRILSAIYGNRPASRLTMRRERPIVSRWIKARAMLDWFIGDWQMFGLYGQNWMLAFGGGLLLYIAVLLIGRRRQSHLSD